MIKKLLEYVKNIEGEYWIERIIIQLKYAIKISKQQNNIFDDLLLKKIKILEDKYCENGCISKADVLATEDGLKPISESAKSIKMIFSANAHIDMNWQWRWDETVEATIDTFRTMLNFMKEYPDFKYSQSQASVYWIIEKYAPEMLEEIKMRIKEKRWEVTATTWVEPDKNMPNGESLVRHILYTKRYLSKLLDIDPDELNIDYEPDTFGHSINIPEIFKKSGIKYFYHCRGYEGHHVYRWKSPSGAEVLTYREAMWYTCAVSSLMALNAVEFCENQGINTFLVAYGVGNHGGGPTRRDLNRIIDMSKWPIYPTVVFGTMKEFFEELSTMWDRLPVVNEDLNAVFDGCFTSQSRIKEGNKVCENILFESELFSTLSRLHLGKTFSNEKLEDSWRNVLFNQFHDILPGSGIIDTREHAMGLYQESLAIAGTIRSQALRSFVGNIDTSSIYNENNELTFSSTSEGSGVGFGASKFGVSQTEQNSGRNRAYIVFNPSLYNRDGLAEIVIWDWEGNTQNILFSDINDNIFEHQIIESGDYWLHKYIKALVKLQLPAGGYSTVKMTEKNSFEFISARPIDGLRKQQAEEFCLENEYIKVTIDSSNGIITSIFDKETHEEMISPNKNGCLFNLIKEESTDEMSSWIVGRYLSTSCINSNAILKWKEKFTSPLRQSISVEFMFSNSKININISLEKDSHYIKIDGECDFREFGSEKEIPQLSFSIPLKYCVKNYRYDVPFGTIIRPESNIDNPSQGMVIADRESGKSILMVSKNKYAFRCYDNRISLPLIRASIHPDPTPEVGKHKISFMIGVVDTAISNSRLINLANEYNHPFLCISAGIQKGQAPSSDSLMAIEGDEVGISGIKYSEDADNRIIIRLFEANGKTANSIIKVPQKIQNAWICDVNEREIILDGGEAVICQHGVMVKLPPNSIVNVCIEFCIYR